MAKRAEQRSLPGFEPEPGPRPRPSTDEVDVRQLVSRSATPAPESLAGQSVWVIDAHSLIHQVFHAMPGMSGPHGEPVGAIFGFTRDVLFLLDEKKPDFLFAAFDLPGKTFRQGMYEAYKAHRPPTHEDLLPQLPPIYRMMRALGIPALGREGYEADDVMATLARQVDELGGSCILVTGDKDCRQLIGERVKLYNIRKDQMFDRDDLAEEWGIAPEQVPDFQGLVGDSSDNVPGVPLIGPKLASQLLQEYETLDAVLNHADDVSGAKRKENLKTYRQQALLSRRLARLVDDVPVPVDWEAGRTGRIERAAVMELFEEYGFRSLVPKLDALHGVSRPAPEAPVEAIYHLVDSPEALERFLAELRRQKSVSVDTETTELRPRSAELVGLSFAWNQREGWYLPLRAPEGERHLDPQPTLKALGGVLEDPAVEKVGQNLKFDRVVLRTAGVDLRGIRFDTMVASYLLEAGERVHNLNDLARRYLGHTTIKIAELIGSGKNQKQMDEVPVRRVADYAGEDALLPMRLRPILAERLAEWQLQRLFDDVEMPLVEVLADMEYDGIKVDVEFLGRLSREYGQRMAELEQQIHDLAGRPFNIGSPRQLQEILFDELKLPVVKKTAKTGPSTDAEVLEELARVHPLPAKILEYRQYAKLKSTYVDALPQMVCPATGRVHASFHQAVAATGRLSSSDPNLQNIPVRTREGREIRGAFVPGEAGWLLLTADYSQIELRVLAHFSGDERLLEAFANDEDIHARVASQVNGVPLGEVTPEMRRAAKAVNFGVIYGQSAFGLSRALGIPKEEAARFIDSYFEGYPRIEGFLEKALAECRKNGYVSTILGRRRAIRGVRAGAGRQRNLPERTAVNTVIQGSAADLIKLAMIAVHRRLKEENLAARMLLQIHDELIFEVPPDQLDRVARLVRDVMSGAAALSVPLKVDVEAGPNWAETKPIVL